PRESEQTFRASPIGYAASRSRLPHDVPIPRDERSRAMPAPVARPLTWRCPSLLVDEALLEPGIGLYSPVAKEWPVAPDVFEPVYLDISYKDFFLVAPRLGYDNAEWIGNER